MKTIQELKKETRLAVVIADHQGMITYINGRFTEVFGWNLEEIVGRPLTTIIPQNLHDAHHLGFSRFLSTGQGQLLNQPLRLKAVTKSGKDFEAEHWIVAEKQNGEWVFGATLDPLT